MLPRIESLLSARLFLAPQTAGDHLYFISNLSGRLSLFRMRLCGSVPEPLLLPQIALQNPELLGGAPYMLFPGCGRILLCLDRDGDERYQPMLLPLDGSIPKPVAPTVFEGGRLSILHCDAARNLAYLNVESLTEQRLDAYRLHVDIGAVDHLHSSRWGAVVAHADAVRDRLLLVDGYTAGDTVLLIKEGGKAPRVLQGIPIEERAAGAPAAITGIKSAYFTASGAGVLMLAALFSDAAGPCYQPLEPGAAARQVTVRGLVHTGAGEADRLQHLEADRYLLGYNIDGSSWLYDCRFDEAQALFTVRRVLCGEGELSGGTLEAVSYERAAARFALSFCSATSPTQLYTVDEGGEPCRRTDEKVLGVQSTLLALGEDASFNSFDGLRVSARLYLPSPTLGFNGPRPLVYYIHGGPQGQERPNFAWFSMPLIQFLALNGFAVFVPNVRGSTGYGIEYMKKVDHDWGGDDRLDHVHAMKVLAGDARLDIARAAVVGRSYGGYMTLTLASRHPDLWAAAVDMFGPYDLFQFYDSIPVTWQAYMKIAIGDPDTERAFLTERSPRTHMSGIRCPLLVIQGQNDPRVVEAESRAVVETLRAAGKSVDYLLFDDEGHDVLKFENRVRCYNAITQFFVQHLRP